MILMEQLKIQKNIIADINAILSKHGITELITLQDITITDKTISDLAHPTPRLSNAIIEYLWPTIDTKTVFHYTSRHSAEEILNSGIFRLSNIEKRYGEGEIETFCKTHKLTGYLRTQEDGTETYRSLLMPNTFYASFTDAAISDEHEEYFWRVFAGSDGVRLKLNISAKNVDFRKVKYEITAGAPIPIISELNETIRVKYGLIFILRGLSRLCSFYLSGADYGHENEFRLLYRYWDGSLAQPIGRGPSSYIELPLDVMGDTGYRIDVLEVHSRTKPDIPDSYIFNERKLP